MKKLSLLLILVLALFSCSGDDSGNGPDGLLKRKIIHTFAFDHTNSIRYYYNGYKLDRTESSDGTKTVWYYDGDLIVNAKTYGNDGTELIDEEYFEYDQGRLSNVERFDRRTNVHIRIKYVYNQDQTVTATNFAVNGQAESLASTEQLFFENGQVIKGVLTVPDQSSYEQTILYSYDDKRVPEYGITGFDKISAFDVQRYGGSIHNLSFVTITDTSTDLVTSYDLVRNYNENGMPTWFGFGESGTVIIDGGSVEYIYN